MGKITNSGGLDHQLLIRLDANIIGKLKNHAMEQDMSMSAIVRRSLRQFFENEELKTGQTSQKTIDMKGKEKNYEKIN